MAVTDEKITRCAKHYRDLLDALPEPPESLSRAPDSRLHVIIERAGGKRKGEALLARLDQAFAAAGITTHPRLTDSGLDPDDRVYMFDAKHPIKLTPTHQLFHDEKTLENFILANQRELDLLRGLGLSPFKEQATLDSGRRIDLLCTRPSHNQLVAIELKVREPDDRATGQLQQYLDDLAKHAKNHGFDSAHLILISGQPDKTIRDRVSQYAAARGLTVTFFLYKVQMDLVEHP